MKRAMIHVGDALTQARLATTMLLQVHDEVVLEAPDHEVEEAKTLVKETMENAFAISVPLVIGLFAAMCFGAAVIATGLEEVQHG